jgi:hypothetical protein
MLTTHGGRGLFLGCSELTESILGGVSDGELALVDELPGELCGLQ